MVTTADDLPDNVPLVNVPIGLTIIREVADEYGVDVVELSKTLETIHEDVTERARDLTEQYTREFGDEALIMQADLQQLLYVVPDEWDELEDRLELDAEVVEAAKVVHDRQADRYDENLDRAERAPELEVNEVLVMGTPILQDLLDAGLTHDQALVQALRMNGDSLERIQEKIGISIDHIESHVERIDRKIDQAENLLTLVDESP